MAHKEKKAYTLYKELLEMKNLDGYLISLNCNGIVGSILKCLAISNRRQTAYRVWITRHQMYQKSCLRVRLSAALLPVL